MGRAVVDWREFSEGRSGAAKGGERLRILVHLAIIVILGGLIYANTLQVPFTFDDDEYIVKNPLLRDFRGFSDADYAEQLMDKGLLNQNFRTRIVTFFTFAVNYQLFGNSLAGYHLVNLLIHLLNGMVVYWLMRLTMRTPFAVAAQGGGSRISPGIMALLTALLFVSHPVQTEAVTYISQRFTALATLFYLAALATYVAWRLAARPAGGRPMLYLLALLFTLLAMKSKEISFTLPLLLALYEYFFLAGRPRQRWLFLLPFLLTMLIIPVTVLAGKSTFTDIANLKSSLHESGTSETFNYLFTQFRVIVTYLRLLLLPVAQNLDYSYPTYTSFFQPPVLLSFLFLTLLAALGGYLFLRSGRSGSSQALWLRMMAFGIFWFFLALAVESTFIPLQDVIFEHRLYLPSVGFFLVLAATVGYFGDKAGVAMRRALMLSMLILVLVWSGAAHARNGVWHDHLTLLTDIVRKSPDKVRPHCELGGLYKALGRDADAIRELKKAIELDPWWTYSFHNLADIYSKQGDYVAAVKMLEEAGDFEEVLSNPEYCIKLGELYLQVGRFSEAEGMFSRAILLDPQSQPARAGLERVYLKTRRTK